MRQASFQFGTAPFLMMLLAVLISSCSSAARYAATESSGNGKATYYGDAFHGRRTASGETFDMNALTAAHRSLAFGTKVRVTNLSNGKSVTVRINDRMPQSSKSERIIDLSLEAAKALDMIRAGVVSVSIEIL